MIPSFAQEIPVFRLVDDAYVPVGVIRAAVGPGVEANTADNGRLGWTDQITLYVFESADVRRHDQVIVNDGEYRVVTVNRYVNPFSGFGSDRLEVLAERTTKE